jgi:hypothetical protein
MAIPPLNDRKVGRPKKSANDAQKSNLIWSITIFQQRDIRKLPSLASSSPVAIADGRPLTAIGGLPTSYSDTPAD